MLFSRLPSGGALIFGVDDAASDQTVDAQIAATLPALQFAAAVAIQVDAQIAITLPALQFSASARYDSNTARPIVGEAVSAWHQGGAASGECSDHYQFSVPLHAAAQSVWHDGAPVAGAVTERVRVSSRLHNDARNAWQAARRISAEGVRARQQAAQRVQREARSAYQAAQRLTSAGARSRWQAGAPIKTAVRSLFQQGSACAAAPISHALRRGVARQMSRASAWQQAGQPAVGKWTRPVTPVTPGHDYTAALLFYKPAGTGELIFNWYPDRSALVVVPVRRAYIVMNSVTLTRLDTGAELGVHGLRLAVDADSWMWSWSADLDRSEYSALLALDGEPLDLLASVNGYDWRVRTVGMPTRTRSFNSDACSLRGGGRLAWLAAPEASPATYSNATAMSAQQLMAMALTTNGVSLGVDIDWQIDDWQVPAGAWSLRGTPFQGVQDVADAVRAIIQSHRTDNKLTIMPRYPVAPWAWADATPDISIPLDALDAEATQSVVRPDYNAIYVSGQAYGVLGRVVRSGTAADKEAPQVSHALIGDATAVRQRGLAELGDTGKQLLVTIDMDISTDVPLAQLNQLAAIDPSESNWRGLVRGLKVTAERPNDALVVSQSVQLERHNI